VNTKFKLGLLAVPLVAALCACGGSDTYVPTADDADYAALQTVVVSHPGQHCVMEWGNGVYVDNCYPVGTVIPYSVHVYYPRGCGCNWAVASRPANYRPVYVNKTTYQTTVINKQTTVHVNGTGSTTTSNSKTSMTKKSSTTSSRTSTSHH
jgi:hypothetical protein